MKIKLILLLLTITTMSFTHVVAQSETEEINNDRLVVVWTSDDPFVAERVALMYTHGAKTAGWFSDVTLIIWGPSAKLTAENLKVQQKLKEMQESGVVIEACVACAKAYGVVSDLQQLGFEVKPMGKPLSDYLKTGAKVITF